MWNDVNSRGRIYSEAVDYGIRCDYQDLDKVIDNIKKFYKEKKMGNNGSLQYFGFSNVGHPNIEESCLSEWLLRDKNKPITINGCVRFMHYMIVLRPNRHTHILKGKQRDAWVAPDHREFDYIIELRKFDWFYIKNGERIECDGPEHRRQREEFFDGLLRSIGYELVELYRYEPEEMTFGCRECGTWYIDPKDSSICTPYKRQK